MFSVCMRKLSNLLRHVRMVSLEKFLVTPGLRVSFCMRKSWSNWMSWIDLEMAGFIRNYFSFGRKETFFYLFMYRWIEANQKSVCSPENSLRIYGLIRIHVVLQDATILRRKKVNLKAIQDTQQNCCVAPVNITNHPQSLEFPREIESNLLADFTNNMQLTSIIIIFCNTKWPS